MFQTKRFIERWLTAIACTVVLSLNAGQIEPAHAGENEDGTVRFATFNVSFSGGKAGQITQRLATGEGKDFERIALIIQTVRPDVVVINEFDFDAQSVGLKAFEKRFLRRKIGAPEPIEYPYVFCRPVNTGIDTGLDINRDGKTGTAEDAYGYGQFPGQYGMAILSRYPIEVDTARTFQKFLWKSMPDAKLPVDPVSDQPYFEPEVLDLFRLSSKSHWDVPVNINGTMVHVLAAHPTPPTFDGDEDRNGRRNYDEIRLLADYVGGRADYLVDDAGGKGGLDLGQHFIIAGDFNADPIDGDSLAGAMKQLLCHRRVNAMIAPKSEGAVALAKLQGGRNIDHQGDPATDTADFGDRAVGNLRTDYVLASRTLKVKSQAVFWPRPDDPRSDWISATDHRMVYLDVVVPK